MSVLGYYWWDPAKADDPMYGGEWFSAEDIEEARREGSLVHPQTGELIFDFETNLTKAKLAGLG